MGSDTDLRGDRIAAFAATHGIDIKLLQTAVRIEGLAHPSLAILEDGNVPEGSLAARQLRQSVTCLNHLYSSLEQTRIQQLASLAEAFHIKYDRDPTRARGNMHPLGGDLGLSFYYPAFVPRLAEHEGLVILRALLLRVVSHGKLAPTVDKAAKRIRDVLTRERVSRFDKQTSPELAAQWHVELSPVDLTNLVAPYFEGDIGVAGTFAGQALYPSKAASKPEPPPAKPPKPEPPKPRTTPPPSIHPPQPIHPGGYSGIRHYTPPPSSLDVPPADEIPPEDLEGFQHLVVLEFFQDEDEPLESDPADSPAITAFEFERLTKHHMEGALLPDTDRVLTTIESAQIWQLLSESLASRIDSPYLSTVASVCASLMLITGRRREECIHALRSFLLDDIDPVPGALEIDVETWTTTIQELPPLRDLPIEWFRPTSSKLQLSLPDEISRSLHLLREKPTDAGEQIGQTAAWDECWAELRASLRAWCPRYTETRSMNTLAVQTFVTTGHLREAQWLSGSSLQHTNAAGHYYATPAHRLQSSYHDALATLGIDTTRLAGKNDHLIGASRAAIEWQRASNAIQSLASRTEECVRLTHASFPTVLDGVGALGAYLALLFGACTAHRFTGAIANISRRDFLYVPATRASWSYVLVADKSIDVQLDARLCVLPALVTEQVEAYLRQLERLERFLQKPKHANATLLRKVRRALNGDGPLWFSIEETDSAGHTLDLKRHFLAAAWPEWAPPLPLLRHLFASNAGQFGVSGADIAMQMGHSIGDTPFDLCDPESPATFAARVADNLQQYIEALGFRSIGSPKRYDPPDPLAPRRVKKLVVDHHRLNAARRHRRGLKLPEPTDSETEKAVHLVTAFIKSLPADTSSGWLLENRAIQEFLEQTREESLGTQRATRRELAVAIQARHDFKGASRKRRPFIPQLNTPNTTYDTFARLHFDCARWALALERQALSLLDRSLPDTESEGFGLSANDVDAVTAAATLLLAIYGAGTTTDRILSLLDPDCALHAFEGIDVGLLAEVSLDPANQKSVDKECQLLSGDVVALVKWVRNNQNKRVTKEQIEKALHAQPELEPFLPPRTDGSLANTLAMLGLARQCYVPGTRSAWERGELKSVGPSLGRLAPLFSATLEQEYTAVAPAPVGGREKPKRTAADTEYRRLRTLVYNLAENRDGRNARSSIADINAEFQAHYGTSSLIALLSDFVIYLLDERGLKASSSYDYLTAIGKRLLAAVGPGDIHEIDVDDLELALRGIAIEQRSGDDRTGIGAVGPASAHFSSLLRRNGVELDLARAFDGLEFNGPRRPGYMATQREIDFAASQLATVTDRALTELAVDTMADTATIAEAGGLIQMATGLRLAEASGLLRRDVDLRQHLAINVHPTKRRGLKTRFSRRAVTAPMTDEHRSRLEELLKRLGDRAMNRSNLLLAPDTGTDIAAMKRIISSGFREAARRLIGDSGARGHIARHNVATSAVLATHSKEQVSPFRDLEPLAHQAVSVQRLLKLRGLPVRLQFRYLSRQLGHATPRTTLEWYAHALPLLHAQVPPWEGLPRSVEATLIQLQAGVIDDWRRNQGGVTAHCETPHLSRWNPSWLGAQLHARVEPADTPSTAPEREEPPLTDLSASLVAWVSLFVREGVAEYAAANWLGLRHETYDLIAATISERDIGFRIGYLSGRRKRYRSHDRIPRAHDLNGFFKSVDGLLSSGVVEIESLRRWLLQQLPGKRDRLHFGPDSSQLMDLVQSHKRVQFHSADCGKQTYRLQPADRKIILLVIGVITWHRRSGARVRQQI